jgi:hypothetical protein
VKYPANAAAAGYEIPTAPLLSDASGGFLVVSNFAGRSDILRTSVFKDFLR